MSADAETLSLKVHAMLQSWRIERKKGCQRSLGGSDHAHRGLQSTCNVVLGSHNLLRDSAHAIGSRTDGHSAGRSHARTVRANGPCIRRVGTGVPETRRRSKVQGSEGARLAEQMPIGCQWAGGKGEKELAYGLGITARSSKELTRGVCARTAGLKGLGAPNGLSGRTPFWRSL